MVNFSLGPASLVILYNFYIFFKSIHTLRSRVSRFTLKIRHSKRYRDGPRGTEEPEPPAAGGDHAGGEAAGGPAEHAGAAAEGDRQMFQEMYHQPGLLTGQQ